MKCSSVGNKDCWNMENLNCFIFSLSAAVGVVSFARLSLSRTPFSDHVTFLATVPAVQVFSAAAADSTFPAFTGVVSIPVELVTVDPAVAGPIINPFAIAGANSIGLAA